VRTEKEGDMHLVVVKIYTTVEARLPAPHVEVREVWKCVCTCLSKR
jgi:hypothetical protein